MVAKGSTLNKTMSGQKIVSWEPRTLNSGTFLSVEKQNSADCYRWIVNVRSKKSKQIHLRPDNDRPNESISIANGPLETQHRLSTSSPRKTYFLWFFELGGEKNEMDTCDSRPPEVNKARFSPLDGSVVWCARYVFFSFFFLFFLGEKR